MNRGLLAAAAIGLTTACARPAGDVNDAAEKMICTETTSPTPESSAAMVIAPIASKTSGQVGDLLNKSVPPMNFSPFSRPYYSPGPSISK